MTNKEVKALLKNLPKYDGKIQINEFYIRRSENKYFVTNLNNSYGYDEKNKFDSGVYGWISLSKVMELFLTTDKNEIVA